ncbi:MAG: hypothetical protein ABEL76_16860, partial [Bradymonadaceae bacterium]
QTDGNRCRPGLACRLRPQGRPQTCGPFAGEGEPCFPEDCRDGLACVSPKPGPEVCRPKQQKGKSCRFSFQCQKGLACVPAPSGDGEVCLPPAENVYERCPLPDAS